MISFVREWGKSMKNNVKPLLMVLLLSSVSVFAYQNCSSSASFTASENLAALTDDTIPLVPQYATKIAGDADSFPPLKLLFVVDNSGTMEVNQINLATAFDRMFVGANATNLAPFDTTAYVISTSQYSPDKTSATFAKLPTKTADSFATLNYADFVTARGATLTGAIPGDLVGYGLSFASGADRDVTSFYPAPVALFKPGVGGSTAVSLSSHKARGGSVDEFSADFKERLAILNPSKSAIDPTTKRGVLDDVIDNESGLCAVARVLKNNTGFLNPGDLASIIIVSDENDSDVSGRACYDQIIEAKSGVNYVDGHCDAAQTNLQYRAAVTDPSKAKCSVSYQTGFSYNVAYKLPTTDVKYYTKSMQYDQLYTNVNYYTASQQFNQLRTSVSYYTSKQTYDKIETPVTYYTKSPTYSVPQTNVKYYTKVESCTVRDGIKTNCTYTYPSTTVVLSGDFKNQCATFVAGKLPSTATTDAGYLPSCTTGTPVAKSGACSTTDTNVINCVQNYSSPVTIRLTGKVTSTCDAYVSGRLPTGALTSSTTDAGYTPACGNLITTADQVGACTTADLDKANCKTVYTAATTPTILTGVPGTKSCNDYALNRLPTGAVYGNTSYPPTCATATPVVTTGTCSTTDANVTDCKTIYSAVKTLAVAGRTTAGSTCEATFKAKLPSGTVFANTTYPISCADGTTVKNVAGTCVTTNTNIENCKTVYSATTTTLNIEGAVASNSTCATFISGRLPSTAATTDAGYLPTCAVGASKDKAVTGSELYSKWPSFTAAVGAACSTDVRDSIVTSKGLVVAAGTTPTCAVTALTTASQTLSDSTKDLTCAIAAWKNVCDASSSANRNCVATDIAAGAKYEATAKTVAYEGSFTCDTLCSKTGFCPTAAGTVGDNYYECKVSTGTPLVKSTFVLEPETATCKSGQTRVVTKGPYKTTETKPSYVAGAKSEANSSTALPEMIVERAKEIFKEALPIVSVFVRQTGDTLGTNGSYGTEYNRLADMLGGKKLSVLGNSSQYATALEDLSSKIRTRLGQSVSFRELTGNQQIRRVWLRTQGTTDFKQVETSLWSASGGTITLSTNLAFTYGDEFKIEYW